MINIQELTTKKENKTKILRKLTEPRTNRKIFAITKTYLSSAQHYDAEIVKYFHNYKIHRASRDTKYNPDMAGKIRFSGAQKFVLVKASSGERWVSCNFVHLMTLRGTDVYLIIYLFVHQMKQVMER